MRIVSLPWYDAPRTARGLDRFWAELRAELAMHGVDRLPSRLERGRTPEAQWADPNLLLSQCCGLDLFAAPARRLAVIGRPVFADLDCPPGHYFSYIVARPGRLPPRPRLAVNATTSRSGYGALLGWLAGEDLAHAGMRLSGSHGASLELIRRGGADLAAIDAHSWPHLDHGGITIIARSDSAPTPPYVSHGDHGIALAPLFAALGAAIARAGADIAISALLPAQRQDYAAVRNEAEFLTAPPQALLS